MTIELQFENFLFVNLVTVEKDSRVGSQKFYGSIESSSLYYYIATVSDFLRNHLALRRKAVELGGKFSMDLVNPLC